MNLGSERPLATWSVRLFARAKDLAGTETIDVALPTPATVGDLRRQLAGQCPKLAGLLERSAVAVDGDFARDEQPLATGAEVALLPPVSGG
ncbi:MAG: MoaD/ThiS family protein [Gemmataceae bacterium]|nr:MoaD/ThiS family protein [Gemmataceae bacterium]MDW8264272.1 MoaD/ThiS family protein [Gemmataceae bacterium]